jgi:hypothetical protein
MTHSEIAKIPKNQTVTYTRVVVDFRPQSADSHCIQITAGCNLIIYPGELLTCTVTLTTSKLMWISVLSAEGTTCMCLDIKKNNPTAALEHYEYMKMPLALFPKWIIKQYDLLQHVHNALFMWKCNERFGVSHRLAF